MERTLAIKLLAFVDFRRQARIYPQKDPGDLVALGVVLSKKQMYERFAIDASFVQSPQRCVFGELATNAF